MSKIVEWHVQNAIAWRSEGNYSLTKERCESMSVLIEEYQFKSALTAGKTDQSIDAETQTDFGF